eukprot:5164509-Ditylum_brightwellii.AAC.1
MELYDTDIADAIMQGRTPAKAMAAIARAASNMSAFENSGISAYSSSLSMEKSSAHGMAEQFILSLSSLLDGKKLTTTKALLSSDDFQLFVIKVHKKVHT